MAEPRISLDMVVADLADAIAQWNEDGSVITKMRYGALTEFLSTLPCDRPEHALLRAVLAIRDLDEIADRALGDADRTNVDHVIDVLEELPHETARVVSPAKGTPWRAILDLYIGVILKDEPDPLIAYGERNRQLGEEFETIDEVAEPERDRQVAHELRATTVAIPSTPAKSLAGAAVQVRRVLLDLENSVDRADGTHEKALRSALAVMEARA